MKKDIQQNNTLAIICEFNPMHTGHTYLINEAKKITGSNFVVGLLSGNFSQRSEPCILDKYTRAKICTENGIDLAINFPTAFCCNNAEIFGYSAIKILNSLNISYLAFGVETFCKEAFFTLAKFMLNEPKIFKKLLKQNLKSGLNFNSCYLKALLDNIENFETLTPFKTEINEILLRPNNTLALEYIKALIKTKSKIKPILIKRVDNYNSNKLVQNFASASFLRNKIFENNLDKIKEFLPKNSIQYFQNYNQKFLNLDAKILEDNSPNLGAEFSKNFKDVSASNFSNFNLKTDIKLSQFPTLLKSLILYKIKTIKKSELKNIYSVSEGLENKLKLEAESTNNFDEFYKKLLTKRYKQSKINSVLLSALLSIDKKTIHKFYTTKNNIYLKILALNPQKSLNISKINTKFLLFRKLDVENKRFNKLNKKLFSIENNANIVYNLIYNTHLNEVDLYNKMRT